MGSSLISLEEHLSKMIQSSSKAARVAELLALKDVAGLTVMKGKDDKDKLDMKEKDDKDNKVALERKEYNKGKGCCKRKNVADADEGGRTASETTTDEQRPSVPSWDEMTDARVEMTGEIAADEELLVTAKTAAEAVKAAEAAAAKAKTAAETKEAAAVAKATAGAPSAEKKLRRNAEDPSGGGGGGSDAEAGEAVPEAEEKETCVIA